MELLKKTKHTLTTNMTTFGFIDEKYHDTQVLLSNFTYQIV